MGGGMEEFGINVSYREEREREEKHLGEGAKVSRAGAESGVC